MTKDAEFEETLEEIDRSHEIGSLSELLPFTKNDAKLSDAKRLIERAESIEESSFERINSYHEFYVKRINELFTEKRELEDALKRIVDVASSKLH